MDMTKSNSLKSWLIGKDSDAQRDCGEEEKGMTEDEMAGWHHQLHGREFEWILGIGDGQGGLVCCDSWGHKEFDTTEWLNWTDAWKDSGFVWVSYMTDLTTESVKTIKILFTFTIILLQKFMTRKTNL